MNKLHHTVPPLGLGRWLARSLAWAVACMLPCIALWHWVMVVQDADCRTCGTSWLITPLTVVLVLGAHLFNNKAIIGFAPFFRQITCFGWARNMAFGWAVGLRLLLAGWWVVNAMLALIMVFSWFDDGRNMWVE
ncbi:hypothetical protein [Hymenobacter properus]|uniref:Uncharacterized protein n=1 Tax=Hymenobacter properus TaxID=2791026 RepID=A0A931BDS5_9BACT|nr:hypothetical protein [Hymenobacter properus]MBF9142025.1 hypothetical protein [Hymenobacter properus]MBR7720832.1 hypothetical protein [Microvirga sp. SRT04]